MFSLLDRIEFLVNEAFVALRRNSWMTFSAITTVAVAMYFLGGLGYLYLEIDQYIASLPGKFEMRVFTGADSSKDDIQNIEMGIKSLKGVKQVELIPREVAWASQKREIPDIAEDIDNPLPDAFKVVLSDLSKTQEVANKIKEMEGVDPNGVAYFADEHQLLSQVLDLIRKLGVILGGLTLLTSGILIYNAIRLTIVSRRKEIHIIQLLGATSTTIVTPLLIEGTLQGATGGILAGSILAISHMTLVKILESFSAIGKLPLFPVMKLIVLLGSVGAAFGFACAFMAVFEASRRRR